MPQSHSSAHVHDSFSPKRLHGSTRWQGGVGRVAMQRSERHSGPSNSRWIPLHRSGTALYNSCTTGWVTGLPDCWLCWLGPLCPPTRLHGSQRSPAGEGQQPHCLPQLQYSCGGVVYAGSRLEGSAARIWRVPGTAGVERSTAGPAGSSGRLGTTLGLLNGWAGVIRPLPSSGVSPCTDSLQGEPRRGQLLRQSTAARRRARSRSTPQPWTLCTAAGALPRPCQASGWAPTLASRGAARAVGVLTHGGGVQGGS